MKKANISVGVALLLLLYMPLSIPGEVLDRILQSEKIRVATDSNWPPQSFLNDQNVMDGFDVDVARQIAKRLGVAVQFVTPGWDIIVSGDWQDRWDLHVGSMKSGSITNQKLVFPAVYYYTPSVIAVHQDSNFSTVSELSGKAIGAAIGTSHESYLQGKLTTDLQKTPPFSYSIHDAQIRQYENSVNALDDLKPGAGSKLDAVIAGMPTVLDAIDKGNPIKILGNPLFYEPLVISIEAGDVEFNRKLAEIIDEMRSEGILSRLSKKWYQVDYTTAE